MSQIHHLNHPLVAHHLSALRDVNTAPAEFRRLVERLAGILVVEATKQLTLAPKMVETPLKETETEVLAERIALVPILRAGLGMVQPALDLLPDAEVWHLGLYRDEKTATPVSYYCKLPNDRPVETALLLDPMLATGGSLCSAYDRLKTWGVPNIKMLSLLAAPEGVAVLQDHAPDAEVFVCAVDERLNEQKFIVPGLGDAGDRIFNAVI